MYVLTVDQDRSRVHGDQVEDALSRVKTTLSQGAMAPLLAPERTVGDEFQLVFDSAAPVVAVLRALMKDGNWAVGIGVGPAELGPTPRASQGPAFFYAREAVEAAKARTSVRPVVVVAKNQEGAERVTAIAQVLAALIQGRTAAGHAAVEVADAHNDRAKAASILNITTQALSQRLRVANYMEEQGQAKLLERGLEALLVQEATS